MQFSRPSFLGKTVLSATLAAVFAGAAEAQDAPVANDEAAAFVTALYGQRISVVQRTRDTADDLALMTEMLEIAPTLPSKPDAQSALYVRIVEMIGRTRDGYAIALQALDKLAAHNPEHPSAGAQGRLDVYAAWYRGADRSARVAVAGDYFDELVVAADAALTHGDHVSAKRWYSEAGSVQRVARLEREFNMRDKLAEARAMEKIDEEIEQLKAGAAGNALRPQQARRLVTLLALEVGRIDDAGAYAVLLEDADFVKGLQAAVALDDRFQQGDIGDHPPGHWYRAGNWYASLIDEPGLSDRAVQRTMLMARTMLQKYIDTTTQENIEKAKAVILVRQLNERYIKAYGPIAGDGIDIMRRLDPEKHMIAGRPFTVGDGKIQVIGESSLHLPIEGGEHYKLTVELELKGRRNDGLKIWIPVSGQMARVFIDVDGDAHGTAVHGLGYIEDNGFVRLEPGKPAVVNIEVRSFSENEAAILLSFNGREIWKWRGETENLTEPHFGQPPDTSHFAMRVDADVVYHRLELQRITNR